MFEKFLKKITKAEEDDVMEFKPFEPAERQEFRPEASEIQRQDNTSQSSGVELKIIRPESFDEVRTVADNLIAGITVVLNVEVLDRTTIHRMLDFLNGVTYCNDGAIKRVAPTTFIITPHSNIDISDM